MENIIFKKSSDPIQSAGLATLISQLEHLNLNNYKIENESLMIKSDNLEQLLLQIYYDIGEQYYDISTKKQKSKNEGFYFDTKTQKIILYPKVKPIGFVQLINDSRPLPKATSVKLNKMDKKTKEIIRKEAEKQKINISEKDTIYIDDRNTAIPKLPEFNLKQGNKVCFVCGESYEKTYEAVKYSPFLGGTSAGLNFVSNIKKAEQVCWKCMYLNRLSVGRFLYNAEVRGRKYLSIHSFFFNVDTLEGLNLVNNKLMPATFLYSSQQREDCDYLRNFSFFYEGKKLIPTFYFFEKLLALIYTLYIKYQAVKTDDEDTYDLISFDNVLRYNTSVYYINAQKFGQTIRPTNSGSYDNLSYLFGLFDLMKQPDNDIDMYSLYLNTVDYSALSQKGDNKYDIARISREKIAQRILVKRSILDIVERLSCKPENYKNFDLLNFIKIYESYIDYGGNKAMNDEIRNLALNLGTIIGAAIVKDPNNIKIGKAKIIQLRKSRNLKTFMDVLISIQFRFNIPIGEKLLKSINEDNFNYVRPFCVIKAMNTIFYNEYKKSKRGVKNEQ